MASVARRREHYPSPLSKGLTPERLSLAQDYRSFLGLPGANQVCKQVWLFRKVPGRGSWEPSWDAAKTKCVSDNTLTRALGGKYGLDISGLKKLNWVGFDFDFGHKPTKSESKPVAELLGEAAWPDDLNDLDLTPKRLDPRVREPHAGEQEAMRAVRRAFPGVEWFVASTPRGVHVYAMLSEWLSPKQARLLALHILRLAGLQNEKLIEVLPKLEADGTARTTRLPLTGRSRVLSKGLTRVRYRLRDDDTRHMLALPRLTVETFGTSLAMLDGKCGPQQELGSHGNPGFRCGSEQDSETAAKPSPKTRKKLNQKADAVERVHSSSVLGDKLSGPEFRRVLLDVAATGIPVGESRFAVQKYAYALSVSLGLDNDRACEVFAQWLERPIHAARHCQTSSGRAQLLDQFRCGLRHQARADHIEPGRASHGELAQLVPLMLGEIAAAELSAVRQKPELTLEEQLERRKLISERRKVAGRAGAKARWQKQTIDGERANIVVEVSCPTTQKRNLSEHNESESSNNNSVGSVRRYTLEEFLDTPYHLRLVQTGKASRGLKSSAASLSLIKLRQERSRSSVTKIGAEQSQQTNKP